MKKFTKRTLLSVIKENINERAMDFDSPDRPHADITRSLSTGDTPLKKVPMPRTGNPNQNFQELLASERYREVIATLNRYLGNRAGVQSGSSGYLQLTSLILQNLTRVSQLEMVHKEELEKLAVELVCKETGVPENAIEFDVKLMSFGQIPNPGYRRDRPNQQNEPEVDVDTDDEEEQGEPMDQDEPTEEEVNAERQIFNDLKNLNLEKAKQRMINAMIQGGAKKGHYMFHLVEDRLTQITGDRNIINMYGLMMSILDLGYWQLGNADIARNIPQAMDSGSAGTVKVEKSNMRISGGEDDEEGGEEQTNDFKPKVVARGFIFPVLVHEILKGVLEVLAIQQRIPTNYGEVRASENTLEKEIWDLRLGPPIWNRIRSQFPEEILVDENLRELQNYMLNHIFNLPARNFLVLTRELLGKTERGRVMVQELFTSLRQMFNDAEYDESMERFNNELNAASDEIDDDELEDFLGDLGIGLSEPD
jgi:hypothetical protein